MKKIVRELLSLVLLITILVSMGSCYQRGERDAYEMLVCFSEAYPIHGTVYYYDTPSDELEGVLAVLFDGEEERIPRNNIAILLYGKTDEVSEIGIFVTSFAEEAMDIIELADRRIGVLESSSDGEGFIFRDREIVAYGFVGDKDRAIRLLKSIF